MKLRSKTTDGVNSNHPVNSLWTCTLQNNPTGFGITKQHYKSMLKMNKTHIWYHWGYLYPWNHIIECDLNGPIGSIT